VDRKTTRRPDLLHHARWRFGIEGRYSDQEIAVARGLKGGRQNDGRLLSDGALVDGGRSRPGCASDLSGLHLAETGTLPDR
jgi:hypothetical protein